MRFLSPGEAESRLAGRRDSNRFRGGNKMKPSTENEIAGKVHEVKGKIKEKVGQLTNDPDLEAEGFGEKIGGKVQVKIGQVEKAVEKL
jgi:uncharacterized protein YjbJ (UPF0337 family)